MTDALDELDALEARALDEPEGQRALLAALVARFSARSLFSAEQIDALHTRAERALELLAALAVDPRSLGESSALHAAALARALARDERGAGDERRAIALLRDALRWQGSLGSRGDRAEASVELARALERGGRPSIEPWSDALSALRQASDRDEESVAFLIAECVEALAADARARGAYDEAARLEAESDAADDRAIERALARLEPAAQWFCPRWSADAAPQMVPNDAWIELSTGLVARASDEPALPQSMRCARVFGIDLDYMCLCGVRHPRRAASCDQCGVEPMRAARTGARLGHIELPTAVLHPRALASGPEGSLVALALDLSDERLAQVLDESRCLRRAARAPRGADTLEPGSIELREHDEGRTDPAVVIATGEDAVIATLEALDARGAIEECAIERRALEAHRTASSERTQRRVRSLRARELALATLVERGVQSAWATHVPHFSPRWIDARDNSAALREAYRGLLLACEPLAARWLIGVAERRALRVALDRLCAAVEGRGR